MSPEAIATWEPAGAERAEGSSGYSDVAIETVLTLRLLFHLPLRQAEGFVHSLFGMMGHALSAPDHTTLSRRGQRLDVRLRRVPTGKGLHPIVDSTGLSIVGEGEWARAKHGVRGTRGWNKLHLGVDRSRVIVAHAVTDATVDDATTGSDLIEAVANNITSVTADAAYDTGSPSMNPQARVMRRSWFRRPRPPPCRAADRGRARDRTIKQVNAIGRRRWKKAAGYHSAGSRGEHLLQVQVDLRVCASGSGAYWVITPEGTWLVPPGQAIWMPPNIHLRGRGVRCAAASPLRHREGESVLGRATSRAVAYGNDYPVDGRAARLAKVGLDELATIELAPLLLPVSKDPRLTRVMERLIEDPGSRESLEQVAKKAGASPRTLARLFQTETGMTFSQWRTRLRLVESIERLARGGTVTEVALDLGYSSTSSFVHMFRCNLGVPPGQYRPGTVKLPQTS